MEATQRLLEIMAKLRDPDKGCPWDLRQTYDTIVPYTLEEAYEVADTIQRGEMDELRDELGDLLFQIAFYSQIAREEGHFDFNDVASGICEKMIRRHPHVFADAEYQSDEQLRQAWEQQKAEERAGQKQSSPASHMDGVAHALPALIRAEKLQKRAARVGFDWPDPQGAFDKVSEEFDEVRHELENFNRQQLQDELGDLIFAMVNVVRLLGMDAEQTLTQANMKFERRFRALEQTLLQQGITDLQTQSLEQLDAVWEQVKKAEQQN
ncbi:MAG: nucleoside triphosphate pyrophosphohydrolase [Candidatus Thiodiazotropha lotti]|uniref:Nucleoside triphosphate pyrophosphohydrolase n=1 Tax=Candidatus Thiodiazotropha endoloripes TaxID=1818881 RepID=A0A1E2UIN7_9GAMM|nr:nucleoside triphosphate pyrophosphohydrolase [Candidatus Thiodiazotropha endoloripes]MCG7899605.1 nucleoside triphosphate pyrophosphohydrolase [Candidatus Thiodiazotropha weberae]MCG7992697.1 nucleoside triphosphate pyrophosphohydrolase [Candidatus Thiodiazotropha lotti]MCG7901855.1 nucleoside triphosphate pyrophosphohydrolase [Candidatus Thiodiazotropha weberae]MCG7912278.1 nucleoside triphosphate pyrophosphohydrolase [Candidatus Thiodiazotropha weberae]MCG7998762.1 nucleoside triphosphate